MLQRKRITMPKKLWERVVDLAHYGHQGVVKTKARLRAKVWLPRMDTMVEEMVRQCRS